MRTAAPDPQHGPSTAPAGLSGRSGPWPCPLPGGVLWREGACLSPHPQQTPSVLAQSTQRPAPPGPCGEVRTLTLRDWGAAGWGPPATALPAAVRPRRAGLCPEHGRAAPSPVSARGSVRPPPSEELVSASPLPSLCPVVPGSNLVLIGGRARGPRPWQGARLTHADARSPQELTGGAGGSRASVAWEGRWQPEAPHSPRADRLPPCSPHSPEQLQNREQQLHADDLRVNP